MNLFSLPTTQTNNSAAFVSAKTATAWLAEQPQANAPAMLSALITQIEALNQFSLAARERFKSLEVLRKVIFAVNGECIRRFENKSLPLPPSEQGTLDASRRLWRAYTTAYLHCLQACLENDAGIAGHGATVAHRALSCLRMGQMNAYLASAELDSDFWKKLHATLNAAEQLGVVQVAIADPLLGETSNSTINGQYCMALLLHLAQPFALSHIHFSTVTRWLARWREQAAVLTEPEKSSKACCIALDLAQDKALHDNLRVAEQARWLSVTGVLRKIRKRLDGLDAGESPEQLKLGSRLSTEVCVHLLQTLSERLRYPQQGLSANDENSRLSTVGAGLAQSHQLMGGTGLSTEDASPAYGNRISSERIALFGHATPSTNEKTPDVGETWHQLDAPKANEHILELLRPAGNGERLAFGGLISIQRSPQQHCELARINNLYARNTPNDGALRVSAQCFIGSPTPLVAEMREKPSGKISRHPAFLLPAADASQGETVILPQGLPMRAQSIRFYDARTQSPISHRIGEFVERNADHERWSLVVA